MDYFFNFKVALICMVFTLSVQDEPTGYGKKFVFTFLENLCEETLNLTITAFEDAEVTIQVHTNVETIILPGGSSRTVSFPVTLLPERSTMVGQRAVRVTSSSEVALYAFNFCEFSSSSFNVLSVSQLGTEYYIASTGFTFHSTPSNLPTFSIISAENNTTISIVFRLQNSGKCGPSNEFTDGQVNSFELNEHEDLTIYCTEDPTGTFISSSLPVAVVAGHVGTKVPASVIGRDAVAEMLPPVDSYGRRYILHGPGPDRGAVFRILTSRPDTILMTSEGTSYNLDPGDFIELDLAPGEAVCLRSSEAVMVVMYGKGAHLCPNDEGDPFMVILTPVERFGTTFASHLSSLVSDSFASTISVVMKSSYASDLDMGFNVQDIPSCLYSVATRHIIDGNLDYRMPNNATFFMAVYMNAQYEGNAFVLTSSAMLYRRWRQCETNPCLNGGDCSADLFRYTCECPPGYTGLHCEETVTIPSYSPDMDPSTVLPLSGESVSSVPGITLDPSEIQSSLRGTEPNSYFELQATLSYEIHESVNTQPVFSTTFEQVSLYSTSENTVKLSLFSDTGVAQSESGEGYISTKTNVMYEPTLLFSTPMVNMEFTTLFHEGEVTPSEIKRTEMATSLTEETSSEIGTSTSTVLYTTVTTSTTLSTSVTTPTTVSSEYTFWSCPCRCPESYTTGDIPQVIHQLQEDIRDSLIVDAQVLSKQIRKKTSAPDDRPSAKQMGGGAIAILVVVFVIFIITDFVKIVQDIVYGLTSKMRR